MLLPLFYLPPISWFRYFLSAEAVVLEQWEHFPKQTYRNRANIYGANGKLPLIIPIKHTGKRVMNEIEISYAEDWQKLHWKSIKTAYQSSAYFEFYEDRLKTIYETQDTHLLTFNQRALDVVKQCLKLDKDYTLSTHYQKTTDMKDAREAFNAKQPVPLGLEEYYQTFSDKMGFIEDLSILDLLCNKGPEAIPYIHSIKIEAS